MKTVRELILKKNKLPIHIQSHEPVLAAIQKLADHDIGALLVMHGDQIVGVFSERDYARKILLRGRSSLTTPVSDVMKTQVLYVSPHYTLEECLAIMTKYNIRHLPVIEKGKAKSMFSIEDIVEELLEGKKFLIEELTKYITGSHTLSQSETPRYRPPRKIVWARPDSSTSELDNLNIKQKFVV